MMLNQRIASSLEFVAVVWLPLILLACMFCVMVGCSPVVKQSLATAKSPLTFPPACRVWGCVTIWNEYGADLHGAGLPWGLVHPDAQWWADRTHNRWAWVSADGETRLMDLAPTAIQDCWITYGEVTITPTVLCSAADVNCDGNTNTGDVLVVRAGRNWGKPSPAQPRSDVNADGIVDAGDLLVIRAPGTWNASTGPCECGPF